VKQGAKMPDFNFYKNVYFGSQIRSESEFLVFSVKARLQVEFYCENFPEGEDIFKFCICELADFFRSQRDSALTSAKKSEKIGSYAYENFSPNEANLRSSSMEIVYFWLPACFKYAGIGNCEVKDV
jgi:hypothetical protein